jgi:hypothetical protein
MVNMTMEFHVLPTLIEAITITTTFDLWMSWKKIWQICFGGQLHNKKWVLCRATIRIFDMHETLKLPWFPIERSIHPLWLVWQEYAYITDKGANLNTLTNALTNIVSCVPLMLLQLYAGNCYAHVMSKCC